MTTYHDSHALKVVAVGYNEPTRILLFHSTPLEKEVLQEALDLIKEYNAFDSKIVGKVLLEKFGEGFRFVVGREYSPVVYVIPKGRTLFWVEDLKEVEKKAKVDEVAVTNEGTLRLWWD